MDRSQYIVSAAICVAFICCVDTQHARVKATGTCSPVGDDISWQGESRARKRGASPSRTELKVHTVRCVEESIARMQGEVAGGGGEPPMQMVLRVKHPSSLSSGGGSEEAAAEGEGSSRSALSVFKAKEEQIERKKMEVREKVFAQLGRVEEESKRLAFIRQELEGMADPTRKEVESIQRRIDTVNRQLKPLSKNCVKKEKEYKEILEAYNEKSKEKALLVNRLIELVSESERMRMKKLEELNKTVDSLY